MFFRILLLCFGFIALAVVAKQKDSLPEVQSMNASTTLVSSRNVFIMGFFTSEDSDFSYMGIWYTDRIAETTPQHPAWLVNRNTPISNSSGVLSIDPRSGNLFIDHNNAVNPIISLYSGRSESTGGFNRTSTRLHKGNFILKEGNLSLWKHFDHLSDTVLPGMGLGINHKTNHTQSLISWLGVSDPSLGAYKLEWDPRERGLIVKFQGKIRWKSGTLMDNNFEHVILDEDYKYKNVSGEEDYFIYTALGVTDYDECDTPHRQLFDNKNIIDEETLGVIAAVDDCKGHKTAGLDASANIAGCELWEQPKCRKIGQKFEIQTGYFDVSAFSDHYASKGFSDCKAQCWEDCNCVEFRNNGQTGCLFYIESSMIRASDCPNNSDRLIQKRKKGIWITVIVVLVFIVLLFLSGLLHFRREKVKQAKQMGELFTMNGYREAISEIGNDGINEIEFFSFKSIAAATRNFSSDNKLGEGGFGPVYKGEFPEGKKIAVKRLSKKSRQGMIELKNELILTAQLQHTNLVRILGCCIHREERMLVYDYMPNKSLDFFLFNDSKREQLTWDMRFTIIEGIAQGLHYLHKYSRVRVIHRDLKVSNILLDQNMNPKISDFGLARIFKQNSLEENTTRVVGTYGYMAPEYAMEGILSIKSDVYSFGVLVLELLSGRKNNSFYHAEIPFNIVALAWECWNRDAAFELMDPSLNSTCIEHQFLRCVHVGLLCVEDRPSDRPTMAHVISMLVNYNADLVLPKRPAFYTGSRAGEEESRQKISVNDISITEMEAR